MFRFIRIAILLTILLIVAGNKWSTGNRLSSWEKPLWVTIYPVLADSEQSTLRYAQNLQVNSFQDIGLFVKQQASRYGHEFDSPLFVQVAQPLTALPPPLPVENSGVGVMLWSLKMRWWVWRNTGQDGLAPDDVRMFVLYQQGDSNVPLERSVGIKNGSYGVVNAIASRHMAARNRIVVTHELMHVLGASDKYDPYNGQPTSPGGLANPEQFPLYPQQYAEIMAGRISVSANNWRRPASLKSCVVGEVTANEIGWSKEP
jgi:hypothetical protein